MASDKRTPTAEDWAAMGRALDLASYAALHARCLVSMRKLADERDRARAEVERLMAELSRAIEPSERGGA